MSEELIRPARHYADASPNDSADVATRGAQNVFPTGISVGAGTLRVEDLDGNVVNFADGELAAGIVHPIRVKRVHATGTTATAIKLFYDR